MNEFYGFFSLLFVFGLESFFFPGEKQNKTKGPFYNRAVAWKGWVESSKS